MDRYHKRCPFDIGFVLERPHRKASGQRKGRGNVRGKIRIRKVHNYGFALGMLSGEDRLVKGGSLGAGILLLIYYMKLLFSKKGKYWVLFLKHIYLIIKSSMNNAGLPLL